MRDAGLIRVDVAVDSSRRLEADPVMLDGLRVETLRDQRANKLVTLLGRSELRDLIDLYFIERAGLPALDGFDDALAKDGGMDPAWFAWALGEITIKPLAGMIAELDLDALAQYRRRVQEGALVIATGTPT